MRLPLPVVRAAVAYGARPLLGPPVPVAVQRRVADAFAVGASLPAGTTVSRVVLGGRPAETVSTPGADDGKAVLWLHGGAFVLGSPRSHRGFAAHLSAAAGAPVTLLDYRLAPEHCHPAPVDDAVAALAGLRADRVLLGGDSAGGCLALLTALRLRDSATLPAGLALVSPLVDLTLASSDAWTDRDPLVRRDWAHQGVGAFLGAADPVALSPLTAALEGLPPTVLHVSEQERLRPEGELLGQRLRAAGVACETRLLPRLWHDVHLQAGLLQEADDATAALGRSVAGLLA